MRIVFVLPGSGKTPIGGFKVVYEYANHLSRKGYQVTVIHPAFQRIDTSLTEKSKRAIHYLRLRIDGNFRPNRWFKPDPGVELQWVLSLRERNVPDADAVIATSWDTAEWVAKYSESKGRKFYLLQGLETWCGPEARVMATWRSPMIKIVIARWLYDIASEIGEQSTYIPNGLDFKSFGMDVDPKKRNPSRIMMLYHTWDWKGFSDGLAALKLARERVPSVEVDLFGIPPAPRNLPRWIHYHRNPSQENLRKLYNQSSIFVAPSWSEGWGLTASEALQCGCALAATDIGGHREFCIHDRTALLSPPKNARALANNIVDLLQNQEKRIRLARSGQEHVIQFTWDRATDAFEKILSA